MTFPSGNGGFSSNGASNQVPSDASDMRDFESTQVFTPMQDVPLPPQLPQQHDSNAGMNGPAAGKRHHVWPWIVLALVVVLAGACAGLVAFFNTRALPGPTLWGVDVSGKTQQQIAQAISNEVMAPRFRSATRAKPGRSRWRTSASRSMHSKSPRRQWMRNAMRTYSPDMHHGRSMT